MSRGLHWEAGQEPYDLLEAALNGEGLGESPALSRAEFATILDKRLQALLPVPETESRNGVRILDATNARGLTFSHLFVAKLNRGHSHG